MTNKNLDASELRNFMSVMQAGEMSVSRGLELIEMWTAGNYSDNQLPTPDPKNPILAEDRFPMEVLRELLGEQAHAQKEQQHVGESNFETWYQSYARQGISKQVARDAYAAGMSDPLVAGQQNDSLAAQHAKLAQHCKMLEEKLAQQEQNSHTVKVTPSGLGFGNTWVSHERITGENADSLNAGGSSIIAREYMKWLNAAPPKTSALTKEYLHGLLGTTGNDLLELAKLWAGNKVHTYQFVNEAEKIVTEVVEAHYRGGVSHG